MDRSPPFPVSQAADYWGRKWLIVIPSTVAIAGFIVISRAQSVTVLIASFCMVGPAFGSQSLFYAVVSEVLPRKYRASSGIAGILANVIAGLLLRHEKPENYRIYWYIIASVYAVGPVGVIIGYTPPSRELQDSPTFQQKLGQLDWPGYIMITSGLTPFSIALQWSGDPYGWDNAHVIAPFTLGMIFLVILGIYEWRFRIDGLFHHELFGDRNFAIAVLCKFIEGLSFLTTNTYFTWEATLLYRLGFLQGCLRFMMMFIPALVVSPLVGLYSTWRKSLRTMLSVGFTALLVWNILMVTVKQSTPANALWGYLVLAGIGFSCIIQNAVTAAQLSTPPGMISVTTSISISARVVGGTIALAVNNAIFRKTLDGQLINKVSAALAQFGFPLEQFGSVIAALSSGYSRTILQALDGDLQLVGAASNAYTEAYRIAFRNAWITVSCFSATGIIVSCFLRNPRTQFTGRIDAPVETSIVAKKGTPETEYALQNKTE